MAGKKTRPRKAPVVRPRESKLQADVAAVLRTYSLPSWKWWHTPNGGLRGIKTAVQLKRASVVPGIPDFALIAPDGRAHFIELKRIGESLTEDQVEFRRWCTQHGVPHSIAFTLHEALAFLDAIGALRIKIGGAR